MTSKKNQQQTDSNSILSSVMIFVVTVSTLISVAAVYQYGMRGFATTLFWCLVITTVLFLAKLVSKKRRKNHSKRGLQYLSK